MRSSLHGPYGLGYTRATMERTMSCKEVIQSQSSNLFLVRIGVLQLAPMKVESLVIANQDVAVNTSLGLAHTARHVLEVDLARKLQNKLFKPFLLDTYKEDHIRLFNTKKDIFR